CRCGLLLVRIPKVLHRPAGGPSTRLKALPVGGHRDGLGCFGLSAVYRRRAWSGRRPRDLHISSLPLPRILRAVLRFDGPSGLVAPWRPCGPLLPRAAACTGFGSPAIRCAARLRLGGPPKKAALDLGSSFARFK